MIGTDRWRSEPPCVYPPAKAGHMAKQSGGLKYLPSMLAPVRPAVSPDRAMCLQTFSHFLIVNKTSLSLSLSLPLSLSLTALSLSQPPSPRSWCGNPSSTPPLSLTLSLARSLPPPSLPANAPSGSRRVRWSGHRWSAATHDHRQNILY